MIRCAYDKCDEHFLLDPRYPHQKYHCKACGEAARKRWTSPKRKAYMHDYFTTYVRPEQRSDKKTDPSKPSQAKQATW